MITQTSSPVRVALAMALLCCATATQAAELTLPPRGTITIDFNNPGVDAVTYNYAAEGISLVEPFEEGSRKDSGKLVFPAPGSSILSFATGDNCSSVGFTDQKDWIGCFKKGGIGTGKIADGQTLFLGVDQTGPAAGTTVTDWTWRFTAKQNVIFNMVLSIDGAETETLTVYSGLSADGITPGGNIFTCSEGADSNPDSNAVCEVMGTQPWQSLEIQVLNDGELSIGRQDSVFQLSALTGILTCEDDLASGSPTTTIEEIFLVESELAGAVQCRRLPNRDNTACEPVPYLLETVCDPVSGECALDFVHGEQPTIPLNRENFAFLCEVLWPARPGGLNDGGSVPVSTEGQFLEPVLPKTTIEWGGDGTPGSAEPGDVPVDYCAGITPLFSAPVEPNLNTMCGTSLNYLLSEPGNSSVNGGTVAPDSMDCSLLEAYDDILIPAAFPDQCGPENLDCPVGKQIACLIDSRISQIEDPDADCQGTEGDCDTAGPDGPGDVISAESLFRNYELIYIQGDLRMRRL